MEGGDVLNLGDLTVSLDYVREPVAREVTRDESPEGEAEVQKGDVSQEIAEVEASSLGKTPSMKVFLLMISATGIILTAVATFVWLWLSDG